MAPDYQTLMRPVLLASATGEVRIGEVVDQLADKLALSDDEREELLPSGKQTKFANRVHWAKSYLKQAGLVRATRRGHFTITDLRIRMLRFVPRFLPNWLGSWVTTRLVATAICDLDHYE